MILGRTLKAIGVLILGIVAGAALWGAGHWLIGLICLAAAIPVALAVWILDDD